MAKIKDFDGNNQVSCVIEDPRVSSNSFYLFGRSVDKNTFSPKFEGTINFDHTTGWSTIGPGSYSTSPSQSTYGYRNGKHLMLSKGTTSVPGYMSSRPETTGRSDQYYLDPAPFAWLDDTTPWSSNVLELEDNAGSNTETGIVLTVSDGNRSRHQSRVWTNLDNSKTLDNTRPTSNTIEVTSSHRRYNLPKLTDNNYSIIGWEGSNSSSYDYISDRWSLTYDYRTEGFANPNNSNSYVGTYWRIQFLGYSSVDGSPLFINSYTSTATPKWNVTKFSHASTTSPSVSQLYTYSGAFTPGGTNAGGDTTMRYRNTAFSHWYVDPRVVAGTTRVLYKPYYDSAGNYHPVVVTWDTTNDTFTREDDVTITGGLSSTYADTSGIFNESSSLQYGNDNVTVNETFVSGGVRYITVMHLQYQNCLDEGSRTWVTYSIDAADPKALTHHSTTTIPVTPMNIHWLNDTKTLMAVLTGGNTYIYSFNNATGWSLASTITDKIVEIGRDSLDRIWYVTAGKYGSSYPSLHLLTPSLPVTVTLTSAASDYTYSGSNINSTLTVNAINASGARIETNVKLVIEGSSMTFNDGTTIKTVTTSSSGDTSVPIIITGAGYTNVTASIEI